MNTTRLITHWTMQGAAPDLGERFHSAADALAFEEGAPERAPIVPPTALRVRGSDEDEWAPLLLAEGAE